VFTFEHGLTYGLSVMAEHWLDRDSMCIGDGRVCYTDTAEQYHRKCAYAGPAALVAGMPAFNKHLRWRAVQRRVARRMLGFSGEGRLIAYVANLYVNNSIYSPGCGSDTYYHDVKRKVVFDILGKTRAQCLLKLYPTYRYADPDPFEGLMDLPPNVKPVQFIEFRYLRAMADVLLCDSPQSTLGWVWSARVPLIYLDLPSNPLVPPVADALDKAIFRFDCSREGWEEDVRRLLALPEEEFAAQWKAKEPARKEVEEKVVFGPPGKAGKRAAEFIVRETLKRFKGAGA
jgi:hypothetical protein